MKQYEARHCAQFEAGGGPIFLNINVTYYHTFYLMYYMSICVCYVCTCMCVCLACLCTCIESPDHNSIKKVDMYNRYTLFFY